MASPEFASVSENPLSAGVPTRHWAGWFAFLVGLAALAIAVGGLMAFRAITHASISQMLEPKDVPALEWAIEWYGTVVWLTTAVSILLGAIHVATEATKPKRICVGILWSLTLLMFAVSSRFSSTGGPNELDVEPTSFLDWGQLVCVAVIGLMLCRRFSDLGASTNPQDLRRRGTFEHLRRMSAILLCGLIAVALHGVLEHIEFWDPETNGGYDYKRFFAGPTEIDQANLVLYTTSTLFAALAALVGICGYLGLRLAELGDPSSHVWRRRWILTVSASGAWLWTLAATVPWQLRIWMEIKADEGWILPALTIVLTASILWPMIALTLARLTLDAQASSEETAGGQPVCSTSDLAFWSSTLFLWYPLSPFRRRTGNALFWWTRTLTAAATLIGAAVIVYQIEEWFDFEDWRGMLKRGQLPLLRVLFSLMLGLVAYRILWRLFEASMRPSEPRAAFSGWERWGRRLASGLLLITSGAMIASASWPLWGWESMSRNVFARTIEFSDRHDFEIRFLHWLLDFDGDGYAALLHGGDPDDSDPDIQSAYLPAVSQVELVPDEFVPSESLTANPACKNVVVLYLEGIVPRAISAYGKRKLPGGLIATPAMDSIAQAGTLFTEARCFYPSTWDAWFVTVSGRYFHITEMNNALPFGDRYTRYNNLYKVLEQSGINRWCHADCSPYTDLLVPQHLKDAPDSNWTPADPEFSTSLTDEEEEQGLWKGDKRNQRMIEFIESLGPNDRFFMTEHMSDSHFPWNRTSMERARELGFPDGLKPYEEDAFVSDGKWNNRYAAYLQVVTRVDRQIGDLIDALKRKGVYDETAIFIVSDHGCQWWEHEHMYYVSHIYDQSLRVPLIARIPGTKHGTVSHQPVTQADILPTMMEVAGLKHANNADRPLPGRSLLPLMNREQVSEDVYRNRDVPLMTHYDTVGLLHNFETKLIYDRPSGTALLFDLVNDPGEMTNLGDKDPDKLQEMMELLKSYAVEHPEFTGEIARSKEETE